MSKRTVVDLSHTVENGMITYKGLPAPVIGDYPSREESRSRYAPGTEFHIAKIELVHTGWDAHWRTDRYFEGHPFLTEAVPVKMKGCGSFPVRAFAELQ